MKHLPEADRQRLRELKAEERRIKKPLAEARRTLIRSDRAAREKRVGETAEGQRKPPKRDPGFAAWMHAQGLPCVACEAGDPIPAGLIRNSIECAHQWTVKGPMKGRRASDENQAPLCRYHHQDAPNACDKGQRAFWARLGIDVAALCSQLYAAYRSRSDGLAVIRNFTSKGT